MKFLVGFVFYFSISLGFAAETPATEKTEEAKGLTKEQIQEGVQKKMPEVTKCAGEGIKRDPKMTVSLTVDFRVEADGNVSMAKIQKSDSKDEKIHSCVIAATKKMTFAKPIGGVPVDVSYPFGMGRSNVQVQGINPASGSDGSKRTTKKIGTH